MEYIEVIFWVIGTIALLLAMAGLQRIFSPETLVDGFMDLDKLKNICPELFKCKKSKEAKEKFPDE